MREPGATVYAVFDYSAENADELTFRVGDRLVVLQCNDDIEPEWWWCQLDEHVGYVPQNLIAVSSLTYHAGQMCYCFLSIFIRSCILGNYDNCSIFTVGHAMYQSG